MAKKIKPKEIKPGELFKLHNQVCSYRVKEDGSVAISMHKQEVVTKAFVPPTLEEVKKYFADNGYEGAERFYKGYANGEPPWSDSQGKQIRAWKQKAQQVWFTDRNKVLIQPTTQNNDDNRYQNLIM